MPSVYLTKGYLIWDVVTRRRTNGAAVTVAWEWPTGEQAARAPQMPVGFIESLPPILRQDLP